MSGEEIEVIQKMMRFGGSFVASLGKCFMHADPINFKKLQKAFPEYWEEYKNFKRQ